MVDDPQKEIEFFGKITAGCTHEIKNVLAIIKESAGLMEDLIQLSADHTLPHRDKFQRSLESIQKQIQRGTEISTRLNRFAHSTDFPIDTIDLYGAVEQLANLSQRFARLKNVDLKVDPPPEPMTLSIRPLRLLMTLFACLQCCLDRVPPGTQIVLGVSKADNGFGVTVFCINDSASGAGGFENLSADSSWKEISAMARALGGQLELDAEAPCIRLLLPDSSG